MAAGLAVVVGASRGVGLALAKALDESGYSVIACVRNSNNQVQQLANVRLVTGVDINDESTLSNLTNQLSGKKIDVLIITAGTQETDKLANVTKDSIRRQFESNALGPLFTVKALQDQLQSGCKVVLVSSKNASITEVEATGGELYGYRMSKVAVNMAGKTLAGDLKTSLGASVALVHPGVVNTDMLRTLRKSRGVPDEKLTANTISPDESAAKIITLIQNLNESNSGSFWAADTGKIIGW